MDIVILGHKGMLGQMAYKYYESKNYNVYTTDIRFDENNISEWSKFVKSKPNAIIINCIGKIKQKSDDLYQLMWSNAILPLHIVNIKSKNQIFIQPSTDCVFKGDKLSSYYVNDWADADDTYGWSKRLGEVALENKEGCMVVRVSIIGPDFHPNPKGLLGWFLSQPIENTVKGYINHFWNGITTLEWCKQVEKIFLNNKNNFSGEIIQLGTKETYSKYEMLLMFKQIFNTEHVIEPFEANLSINRCLNPNIISEKLETQIQDLKNFF